MKKIHPFHIVTESPWPILSSISAIAITHSTVIFTQFKTYTPLILSLTLTILCATQWWRDVFREGNMEGDHSVKATKGIKLGIILFITSEILFFFSFFWAFFQRSISPNIELGIKWPPVGITLFNPLNIPLINTIILLSSGVSITWAHHAIIISKYKTSLKGIIITVFLGVYFTLLQGIEYWQAPFSIWDSTCGSTFFVATGFHGLHVIIGTIFLIIRIKQLTNLKYCKTHIIRLDCAAWYWHFVDVVWLFLYSTIYWWGNFFFSIYSTFIFHIKRKRRKTEKINFQLITSQKLCLKNQKDKKKINKINKPKNK